MSVKGQLRDSLWIDNVASYYTPQQVSQYLISVGFENAPSTDVIAAGDFPASLENLRRLVRLHLLTFPFENTAMHYTPTHKMDVTVHGAFQRFVVERKGSYCFGNNTVLLGVLRGLGYRVYSGAGRVNLPGETESIFTPLLHMVLFVQPFEDSVQTYLVDVGFGSPGMTQPILLSDNPNNVSMGATPLEHHRLRRASLPGSSLKASRGSSLSAETNWSLQVCHQKPDDTPETVWRTLYYFTEDEFFPMDYEAGSLAVSGGPEATGLFWHNVICAKCFLDKDSTSDTHALTNDELPMYRMTMMGNLLKREYGGQSQVVQTFTEELERIKAIRDIFGIDLPDDAVDHIYGRSGALKDSLSQT